MKLTQASVLGLLGATSAVTYTPSPRTVNDKSAGSNTGKWPLYHADAVAVGSNVFTATEIVVDQTAKDGAALWTANAGSTV